MLIDINEVDLPQLLYWNEKLKTEINERIKDTLCPHCHTIIGEIEIEFCPHCGGSIKWMWEK
ncbi:hypothetical protein LCGC14_2515020 [marine sediment metagenome]|uniref:Zinc-ribbon domain-containing protein n=1 Tax=marine sediment metagenome TaxID=412755 RepID=A0A0F9BKZ6_9ZZZZ